MGSSVKLVGVLFPQTYSTIKLQTPFNPGFRMATSTLAEGPDPSSFC